MYEADIAVFCNVDHLYENRMREALALRERYRGNYAHPRKAAGDSENQRFSARSINAIFGGPSVLQVAEN